MYNTNQRQVNKKFPHHRFTCWVIFLQVVFEAKKQMYHDHTYDVHVLFSTDTSNIIINNLK